MNFAGVQGNGAVRSSIPNQPSLPFIKQRQPDILTQAPPKERLSSKISKYTNYIAGGAIVLGGGPEDVVGGAGAGFAELLGQSGAGVVKTFEVAVGLYNYINLQNLLISIQL